jgi:cell division protein FtsW
VIDNYRPYDRWLLALALMLVMFGALMIYSSTSVITPVMQRKHLTEFYYFKKHLVSMVLGLMVMFAAYRTPVRYLKKAAVPLLLCGAVLLMMVFVDGVGVSAGGARRWLRLWPTTFQPSELVKLSMVVFMAWYMSRRDLYDPKSVVGFIVPIAIMGSFQIVFLKQPDFGAAMSLGVLTLALLYLSGTRLRYLGGLLLLGVPLLVKLMMEPYRFRRVVSFLDPWEHRHDSGFQLVQSFLALGSGGLTGVGLGKSRQKLDFLPEVHTDFIFSMVGEELGFIVALLIVLIFALMFIRGIRIARSLNDRFSYYLAYGLSMMLALQSLVNFCVVTGMLPTKGLPLPFLSYGGSSLLINMAAVGILLNLSRPQQAAEPSIGNLDELMRRKRAKRAVYGEPDVR